MNLSEMALEMARDLLADPHDDLVEVWRAGDEWGWRRAGTQPARPSGARVVVQDRIQGGDATPTTDLDEVAAYAARIEEWLQAESAGHTAPFTITLEWPRLN
jgi:hypothetical protein